MLFSRVVDVLYTHPYALKIDAKEATEMSRLYSSLSKLYLYSVWETKPQALKVRLYNDKNKQYITYIMVYKA